MSECCYDMLKRFFEDSDVGHRTVRPLKQNCVAFVEFEDDAGVYELNKKGDRCVLVPKKSRRAELHFKFTRGALEHLLEPPPRDVHEFMNRYFDSLLEQDAAKKAELKLLTNVIDAWMKGYIKMLNQGGPRAVPTLSKIGIGIPAKFLK